MSYSILPAEEVALKDVAAKNNIGSYRHELIKKAKEKNYLQASRELSADEVYLLDLVSEYNEFLKETMATLVVEAENKSSIAIKLNEFFVRNDYLSKEKMEKTLELTQRLSQSHNLSKAIFVEEISNKQSNEELNRAIQARRYVYERYRDLFAQTEFVTRIHKEAKVSIAPLALKLEFEPQQAPIATTSSPTGGFLRPLIEPLLRVAATLYN